MFLGKLLNLPKVQISIFVRYEQRQHHSRDPQCAAIVETRSCPLLAGAGENCVLPSALRWNGLMWQVLANAVWAAITSVMSGPKHLTARVRYSFPGVVIMGTDVVLEVPQDKAATITWSPHREGSCPGGSPWPTAKWKTNLHLVEALGLWHLLSQLILSNANWHKYLI